MAPHSEHDGAELQSNGHTNGHDAANGQDAAKGLETADGWAGRTAYDYNAYGPGTTQGEWDGSVPIYQWDGEQGDLGPEVPELEVQLFGEPEKREARSGIDFSKIAEIQVFQEGPIQVEPALKFEDAGLHPAMLKNVELCGYQVPTPIQAYCMPAIHKGYDVIGIAQTGSGKTGAYLIPVINKLMGKAKKLAAPRPNPVDVAEYRATPVAAEPLVVIVVPTRELAVQIFNEARKLCYRSMLRPGVCYGGGPIGEQIRQINMGCDILIATPGRLIDFIGKPDVLTLRRNRYMIIDEADEMLHSDWQDELDKILDGGDQEEGNITYLLFSATFPKKIQELAKTHLAEDHVRFRFGRAGSTHGNIVQQIIQVAPFNKKRALIDLINSMVPARTLIFVNSKHGCDELDDFLYNEHKLPCTAIHGDRTQREREDALRSFRAGTSPILIATGVTARGIDVRNVAHVINYDMPSMDYGGIEEYTHRIGRTGRIGHKGLATSFYTDRDEPIASLLTRTLLETKQDVPEFLSSYIPEDYENNLNFDDDDEEDGDEETGGAGWGAGGDDEGEAANGGGAWGASEDKAGGNTNGGGAWGADSTTPAAPVPVEVTAGGGWTGGGSGW